MPQSADCTTSLAKAGDGAKNIPGRPVTVAPPAATAAGRCPSKPELMQVKSANTGPEQHLIDLGQCGFHEHLQKFSK
jgi:hypothetical protein